MSNFAHTTWQRFALSLVVFLPLTVLWALVNPMFASPDEPAHMARAQGFSNGDLFAPFETDGLPVDAMECFKFQSEVTADCQDLSWGAAGTQVDAPTDGYPPLLHAVAAVPALVSSGLSGAYLMRLWLAVVCAVLLAAAAVIVSRPGTGRWPLTGLLLGVTPMVVFTAATVKSAGLTPPVEGRLRAGGLSRFHFGATDRATTAALAVGAFGLTLVRRDGLIWLVIVAAALSPLLPWRDARAVLTRRRSRPVIAVVALATFVAAAWGIPTLVRFLENRRLEGDGTSWQGLGVFRLYLRQVIGQFGWLDASMGEEAFLAALVVAGAVVLLGITSGSGRLARVTVLATVALVAAPTVFGAVRYPYLQGRYLIPIWICLMMAAAVSAAAGDIGPRVTIRLTRLVLVVWAIVHTVAYLQNLRRYAVGARGSWRFVFEDAPWHPPTMPNLVAAILVVPVVLAAALAARELLSRASEPGGETAQTSSGSRRDSRKKIAQPATSTANETSVNTPSLSHGGAEPS